MRKLLTFLFFSIICTICTLSLVTPVSAFIGETFSISPFWSWKTIETEHFRVTFNPDLKDIEAIAQKSANHLEEAHRLLSPGLKWEPHEKTQVLLLDNQDLANGVSSATARFGMILYITPPESVGSLNYYDDWLRLLCIHEYTHTLNLDTTTGLLDTARILFGSSLLPNSLWPSWMLEGLAVFNETRFTHGGRGRGPYFEMVLREAVYENVLDSEDYVTLDRVNGTIPYYPGGEIPYLFGYEVMNEVGELGINENSYRSGGRIPYFINGNIENITGKDWYEHWDHWAKTTKTRMSKDIDQLKHAGLTPLETLVPGDGEILGPILSPNETLLAYTQSTPDRRSGLYLQNLKNKKTLRITDKYRGTQHAFTPSGKALLFSAIRRDTEWTLYSDLAVFDLKTKKTSWLTNDLRAKDPDISLDGKWVGFTITTPARTGLARAPLIEDSEGLRLGTVETLYEPPLYARVSNPRFSPDGNSLIFSYHNGKDLKEDLLTYDLKTKSLKTLYSDGFFNRFPAYDKAGNIYFISNQTGVETLYRLKQNKSALAANVISGLQQPYFGKNDVIATHYTSKGWDISRIKLSQLAQRNPKEEPFLKVSESPAPPPAVLKGETDIPEQTYAIEDYSLFPSILPRVWSPLLYTDFTSVQTGAAAVGYDAVDRHRYILEGSYNWTTHLIDWYANYQTRVAGPTLGIEAEQNTQGISYYQNNSVQLTRYEHYGVVGSFKFDWTWSSLTPFVSFSAERSTLYAPESPLSNETLILGRSKYVPTIDVGLLYSDGESYPLSLNYEKGREASLIGRVYFNNDDRVWKIFGKYSEYFGLFKHSILSPSIKGSMVSKDYFSYAPALVTTQGKYGRLINPFASDGTTTIQIRGYPQQVFHSRALAAMALDLTFPIARIFHGWGTNPLFLNDFYGVAFAEGTQLLGYTDSPTRFLPAYGGGVRLTLDVLVRVPLLFSLEYHRGHTTEAGGTGEIFFQMGLGPLPF